MLTKVTDSGGLSGVSSISINVSTEKVIFKTRQIDFGVLCKIDAEKTETGSVQVSAQVFDGVVSTLIDTLVSVEVDEKKKKMVVITNTSTSELHLLDDSEEVEVEDTQSDVSLLVRREVLVQGFKSVQHAAAESVVKPEIASVFLYTKDGSIYFVATDAFRLAETRFLSTNEVQDDVEVIIPIKSVVKAVRVMDGISDSEVAVHIDGGCIYLKTENILVRMNSVRGAFPDYKNIMPKKFDVEMTVLKGDIVNFLKKARLFSNNLNKLSLTVNDEKTITLGFSNETIGTTESVIPAVIKGGVSSFSSFNYRFFSDALSVVQDDRVLLRAIDDSTKPMMIRGVEDTSFTAVLSPLLENSATE